MHDSARAAQAPAQAANSPGSFISALIIQSMTDYFAYHFL